MNRRKPSLLLLCSAGLTLALPAIGQNSPQQKPPANSTPGTVVQIKPEIQGEFLFRFTSKGAGAIAPAPLPTATGGVVAIPLPANLKPEETELEIYDNTRGNLARLPINTKTVAPVGESAFKYIQAVYVPVQSAGKPVVNVQVALVTADKKYQATWLLKTSDNGVARFENVPMSEPITITVSYAANPPKSVTETLPHAHSADGHHREPIVVDWADVKTLTPTATPVSPSAGTAPSGASTPIAIPAPEPAPSGNAFLSSIMGLLFLGAVGYGLLRAFQNGKLKEVLDKLGIQTAPNADPAPIPNPFTKPQQAPIQPITEGTADPFSGGSGGGFSPVAAAPIVANVPRLIGAMGTYQGAIFPLNSATTIIGRDATNAVPLPNDTNASRRHATLEATNGQFSITDHGSSNGTFVNGVKIRTETPHPLRPGDEVQIGMTRFRFEA